MALRCEMLGVKPLSGNNVSHSQRKTKRSFKPNIIKVTYKSNATGVNYSFNVAAQTKRTIDKYADFDQFIQNTNSELMSPKARKIKKAIMDRVKISEAAK